VKPVYFCLDSALPDDLADDILALSSTDRGEFVETTTFGSVEKQDRSIRRSLVLTGSLGVLRHRFEQHMIELFPRMCHDCGMSPFPIAGLEIEFVIHRDGHFYKPHLDIRFGEGVDKAETARTLSAVFYVHRRPAGFSGGQLRLFSLDGTDEVIEAQHNRLVAFPSILLHEVMPIKVAGNAWEDARFSVNCWFLQ
jgi:SM-20-related protein